MLPFEKEGPPTAEEIANSKYPEYYKRGSQLFRRDSMWHRCNVAGCTFVHYDLYTMTGHHHHKFFHGLRVVKRQEVWPRLPLVSRDEGYRLHTQLNAWRAAQRKAKLPDSPFDIDCNPQPGCRPPPVYVPGQQPLQFAFHPTVQPPPAQMALGQQPPQLMIQPAAQQPPVQMAAGAVNATAANTTGNQQPTAIYYKCYMCDGAFTTRSYAKAHALNLHATRLIQEPFQLDRVAAVECYTATKKSVRLVARGPPQAPGFTMVCEGLRELFYKTLLTVPRHMRFGRQLYDKRIFKVFSLNKAITEEAMPLFSKYNFLIRVNVSSYDEEDIDLFESILAENLMLVPSELAAKLGKPALSISLELMTQGRPARRTKRAVGGLVIYSEHGLVDLCELIHRNAVLLVSLRVEFDQYASDPRFASIKRTVEQYLGYIRGVRQLLWYDKGVLINDDTTRRMQANETEETKLQDLHELVIIFQEQVRRKMIGLARMTEFWVIGNLKYDIQPLKEDMLGPAEGTAQARTLQCAKKQLISEAILARMQLLGLRQEYEPFDNPLWHRDPFEPMRQVYNKYKQIAKGMLRFPGVPDTFRADAHLSIAIMASRIARNLLYIFNRRGLRITPFEMDPHFKVHDMKLGETFDLGADEEASNVADSVSAAESAESTESDQMEESENASVGEDEVVDSIEGDHLRSPSIHSSREAEDVPTPRGSLDRSQRSIWSPAPSGSSGNDADSEATDNFRRSRSPSTFEPLYSHSALWGAQNSDAESETSRGTLYATHGSSPGHSSRSSSLSGSEPRYTHSKLWGTRDSDADSDASTRTLLGNRRSSASGASEVSTQEDAMEGLEHESMSENDPFVELDYTDPRGIRQPGRLFRMPPHDDDAMEDVQHEFGSETGSTSDASAAADDMDGIEHSFTTMLNDVLPSDASSTEENYDTDNMSTTTEDTIPPPRQRADSADPADDTASETSTVVPPRPRDFFGDHEELREDKLTSYFWTMPSQLARTAIHHFQYAELLYQSVRPAGANGAVEESPTKPHLDTLLQAFNHELGADDPPPPLVRVRYGHGPYTPFVWEGSPDLVELWDHKHGDGVAFVRMAAWQARPEGWEAEGREVLGRVRKMLDEIMAGEREG